MHGRAVVRWLDMAERWLAFEERNPELAQTVLGLADTWLAISFYCRYAKQITATGNKFSATIREALKD